MNEDVPDVLGYARKRRGIFEGKEWATSLRKAGIRVKRWDEAFAWVNENVSVQPLQNSWPFLDDRHRVRQESIPNELLIWIYFRIEPDDENCTLLWIETRRIRRVG